MQTAWAAAKADSIRFLIQLGDITNNNADSQWHVAERAFELLDGKVPYAFVTGNHDIGTNGKSDIRNTDLFNQYLPYAKYSKLPYFGGAYEKGKMDNVWYTFSADQQKWLVLCLEFGPRNKVIDWAGSIIKNHPSHKVIIVTHAYMYSDDLRMGADTSHKWLPEAYGLGKDTGEDAVNNGEAMWKKLVSRYPNIVFVFSGHVLNDGTGLLVSKGVHGNKVYQMLSNYQSGVEGSVMGGSGYLRILDIDPRAKSVKVQTYSPYLDAYKHEPDQEFLLTDVTL
ncbi:metallophosphoesterase [Niabella aquatica]